MTTILIATALYATGSAGLAWLITASIARADRDIAAEQEGVGGIDRGGDNFHGSHLRDQ